MKRNTNYSILLFVLCAVHIHNACAQRYNNDIRLKVLHYNQIGKEYKFNGVDSTVTYLKYLGRVQTNEGKFYKIITSVWIWGYFNQRATSRILLFNAHNRYLGNYHVSITDDLPDHIERNKLVFHNSPDSNCNTAVVTYIDLSKGLPKSFFRKCTESRNEVSGDNYTFSND